MSRAETVEAEPTQAERYELPEGWTWERIQDLVQPVSQFNPATTPEKIYRYVDVSSISNRFFKIEAPKIVTGAEAPTRARQVIRAGDVLFSTVRPYLRNVALVRTEADGDVGSTAFCVLRSNGCVEPGYLFRWTLTNDFFEDLLPKQRGISYPAVRDADVLGEPIPLAPLAEQRRIVMKIEALFEQSRTAREALDRIPPLLKKFRQSVLAAAFRGDLSRGWREQNPDIEPASALLERMRAERRRKWEQGLRAKAKDPRKVKDKEPKPVDTNDLPELPEGWVWASLGQLLELVQYGTSVKASASAAMGVPMLRMGNIQDGRLDLRGLKYLDPQDEDIAKYALKRGDVLINRTNSPELVGKAALFNCAGTYVFASYLIRLRPDPGAALPAFINFAINSHVGRRHVQSVKHQVAGQANINTNDIRSMPIPSPPLEEQKKIVATIEGLFTQADAIEAAVQAARRRGDKMEQSILARAFRGELVPQDFNDEPAPALLDRIRAEGTKNSPSKGPLTAVRRGRQYRRTRSKTGV